jgi:hypothetical protein
VGRQAVDIAANGGAWEAVLGCKRTEVGDGVHQFPEEK